MDSSNLLSLHRAALALYVYNRKTVASHLCVDYQWLEQEDWSKIGILYCYQNEMMDHLQGSLRCLAKLIYSWDIGKY